MKIKVITRMFAVLALSISLACPASATELPRMWEVTGTTKGGAPLKFYILGITHNGLASEYDDYLYKKVLPVFSKADVFSMEVPPSLARALLTSCPVPLEDNASNREMISAAREKVRSVQQELWDRTTPMGDTKQRRDNAETAKMLADMYSELGLISKMHVLFEQRALSGLYGTDPRKKIADMLNSRSGKSTGDTGKMLSEESVADYLKKYKQGMKSESIDTSEDMINAYCSTGPGREHWFQSEFNSWEYDLTESQLQKIVNERIQYDIEFKRSLKNGKLSELFSSDIIEHKGLVCTRNPKWLKKMIADNTQKVTFYALGLGHLLPRADGTRPCDDLLTMLRNEGLSVELIP